MTTKRFLLVQSCHLPEFFFVARKLRERHPDTRFDALLTDHPQARFYARLFPLFESVSFGAEAEHLGRYDGVVFPLLSRGYSHIRQAALGKGPLLRVDYSGNLRALGRVRLFTSTFYVSDKPTAEFAAYLENFPHRAGPERVLLIESCHPSLLAKARGDLCQVMHEGAQITHVRAAPLRKLLGRFRGQEFDTAIVFFSGENGFLGLKLLPFLLRIRRIVILNENRDFFDASGMNLPRFFYKRVRYGTRLPFPLPPRIALFQTESVSYLRHTAQHLKQRRLFPHSELILVCRPEDRAEAESIPEVNRVLCYPKRGFRRYYQLWKKLNSWQPDLVCGIFSGRSVYRWEKLLFFVLPASRHLVFNARLDCYQVSVTRLFRMFRSEPLVFDEQLMALAARENYILLLETADDRKMLKAISALRDPHIVRPAPIAVFCSESKRSLFQGLPGVKAVFTYQPNKRWDRLKSALRLRKLNIEVVARIFGDPTPRFHRRLFMALPARNRLGFNADFNCFYVNRLNPLSLLALLRAGNKRCVLLIQTADDQATLRALAKARDPRVTTPAIPFVVFCRDDKKDLFAGKPGVEAVLTYQPNRRLKSLRTLLRLVKMDLEVVSALFTGEPIFRLQKLLFFILPTRNRLVFNHNLDCYYLNRSTFWSLFRSEERLGQVSSAVLLLRMLGKTLLFFPRFFYLVIWVTGQKLKRAYSLASEVR